MSMQGTPRGSTCCSCLSENDSSDQILATVEALPGISATSAWSYKSKVS